MDNRAVSPVVEKTVTIGVVALFLAGMTTTLFGGAVPAARDATGSSVGDRVLAMASERVEQTVPPNATRAESDSRVDLPATIRGHAYAIRADGRSLVLEHPRQAIGGRSRLVLPERVDQVTGRWQSGAGCVVVVRGDAGGLVVRLREAVP